MWIALQSPAVDSYADDGEPLPEPYTTYWEGFAYFRPESGAEGVQTDQVVATLQWACTVRWVPGVKPTHQILYDDRTFQITTVFDPDGKRWTLEMKATEVA